MFLNLVVDNLRIKAHGGDVERVAVFQLGRIRVHDVHGGLQRVRHVHHVHECPGRDRADKLFAFYCRIVDLNGIVCRAASRKCHIGDKSREPYRTGVHTVFGVIIVTKQLGGHLGHAVHRTRPLQRVLRSVLMRSLRAERTDRGWCEHSDIVLPRDLKNIHESVYLDVPCQLRLPFRDSREQGGEIVDCVDVVLLHDAQKLLTVADISLLGGTALKQNTLWLSTFDVAGDNVALRVHIPDFHCQLRTDLSGRTYH